MKRRENRKLFSGFSVRDRLRMSEVVRLYVVTFLLYYRGLWLRFLGWMMMISTKFFDTVLWE